MRGGRGRPHCDGVKMSVLPKFILGAGPTLCSILSFSLSIPTPPRNNVKIGKILRNSKDSFEVGDEFLASSMTF